MPRMQVKVSFSKKNSTFTCIMSRSPTPYAGKIYVFKFKVEIYVVKTMVFSSQTTLSRLIAWPASSRQPPPADRPQTQFWEVEAFQTIVFTR